MPLTRASELDRILRCGGSLVLPREEIRTTAADKAAAWGTYVHYWAETGHLQGNLAYDRLLNDKIVQGGVDRTALWPEEGEHEIALAYHVVERRAIRCKVPMGITDPKDQTAYKNNWKAAMGNEWVTGTADFAMELLDEPWVDDLKTGRRASYDDYLHQQGFYCMAYVLAEYGELREARSTLTHWPKYPKARPPDRFGEKYELAYFRQLQDSLSTLREQVLNQRVKLTVGPQCQYCPSRLSCPSYGSQSDNHNNQE